jgi:hypothetical protein
VILRRIFMACGWAASAAFCLIPAIAQESRGTVTGRVVDPSEAVVPGATIEVTNKAQGVRQTFTTNESGLYQAPYLIPGLYTISASAQGFKRAVRDNVDVTVGERVGVDLTLEIGDATQAVNITAEAELLNTATSSSGQVVDTKRLAELPIAHGQPLQLMGLAAGVAYTGSATLDRPFEPTHIAAFAINGTRANRSDITIDGIPSTATANANEVTASYVPPQDTVQEFRVQTATFDAQFGNTEGGVTNISMKSGTNEFHGSAYYYKQAPSLFANNWFANANNQPRTDFNYDRFGGSFGGYVWLPKLYNGKNRTFFMYGPEAFKDSRPRNNGTPTTLTDANKRGDFSAQLAGGGSAYQIYDPLTRRETSPGVFTGQPFPNNVIPENRINPVSRALLQFWPSPLSPGDAVGRFNFQNPNLLEVTDYFNHTLRLDHNITDSDRLAFRWSSYDRDSNYNNYFGNLATGENFQFVSRATSLDYVKVLNASTVFNIRYGYNRFIRVTANNPESDGFDLTSLGFSQAYANQISSSDRKFPRIDIAGYQGTGVGGEYRPNDTHALISTLNKTLNAHALKFGMEFRSYRENAIFDPNEAVGRFEFDTSYTRASNTAAGAPNDIAQSAAAFLLGLPTRATVNRQSSYAEQSTSWGFFIHDDWRVSNRLTLNIGLRYEFETPLEERYGRSIAGFDPDANVNINGRSFRGAFTVGEPGKGLFSTPKNLFMPRFGFAYRLGSRTVLRGGYGIYYGFLGQRRGDVVRNGFSRTTEINASPNGGLTFTRDLANLFVDPVLEPRAGNEVPPTLVGTGNSTSLASASATANYFNPNPKTPQNQRWQFNVQHELPGSWLVEASYVGNRGTRLETVRDLNALPEQYYSTTGTRDQQTINFLTGQVDNPYAGQLLVTGGLNNARITRWQSLRPYPYYLELNTTTNQGYSWYHSAQLSASRRFRGGYTVLASYTWSKFMEALSYMNPFDLAPAEMISPFDRPHRLSVSAVWELPFGRGKSLLNTNNPVMSRLVGGWQLNGIYTYQTGAPLEWGNGNFTFNGSFDQIALDNPTRERWINTDAGFNRNNAERLEWNVRTFPRWISSVRGHRLSNVDLSVIKNTEITERFNIQFRGEALNAFNSPHFANPETNVTSANFGVVTGVLNYARRIQLGVRLVF